MPDPLPRFVALDVHKAYVVIGAVDGTQTVVLPPRRVSLPQFAEWVGQHLLPTDQVVLETTINAWVFYDQLVPLVSRVVVANPAQVKLIAASLVKTDKRDTLALARLLAANLIPAVWVPPAEVRELRALVTHRQRLLKQRTMAKNRLQRRLAPTQPHASLQRSLRAAPPGLVGSAGAGTLFLRTGQGPAGSGTGGLSD